MISHPAIAAISAAILAYEVLLVRLFAIVQWHHFAFMAITVALLGFGISGSILVVVGHRVVPRVRGVFVVCAILFAGTAPAAFLASQGLPFNALKVIWAPSQLLYLGVIFLLLAVPFTAGAACIGLAFMTCGAGVGRVYRANLLGSGAGSLGILLALQVLSPMACLGLVSAVAICSAALQGLAGGARRRVLAVSGTTGLAIVLLAAVTSSSTSLRVSEFKGLSRALEVKDARLVREYSSALELLSVVESPSVPFRYAPGLSLTSPALPPPQLGVFADGEFASAIDAWDAGLESLAYLDQSTDALAYHLHPEPEVLVLGAGGGRSVLQAVAHRAPRVDAVELNPHMVRLVRDDFADRAGGIYSRREVKVHTTEARRFLTVADRDWNLIHMFLLGAGPTAVRGLNASYLHTVQGFELAYRRLRPDGWLSVTSWIDLPPRTMPKLVTTIRAALEGEGVADPAARILLIRGITTVTLLVKRGLVSLEDISRMKEFASVRGFDLVHYPGMAASEANRRNILAQPAYFEAATALLGPESDSFISGYKFDIAPAYDDRPYFHDYFSWRSLPELISLGRAGGAALLDLGELIVAATLVQAVVLSLALVIAPLRMRRYRQKPRGPVWRFGTYFAALGLAFLFVEIAWIQKFGLFLGHPLYAVSVVVTGFLVFAGFGAGVASRLEGRLTGWRLTAVDLAVLAITLIALIYLLALPALFRDLSGFSDVGRVLISLTLIAPLAFVMGMPFPLGLARLAKSDPDFVPWAWGINGCASVVSVAAATLLTMHLGFSATVVIAVGLYLLAALVLHTGAEVRI